MRPSIGNARRLWAEHTSLRRATWRVLLAAALAAGAMVAHAQSVSYAIVGARVVTASGPTLPSATVVIRNGVIDGVGPDVTVPADAVRVDGRGLVVYPGLIDMGTVAGLSSAAVGDPPAATAGRPALQAWRRDSLLRPQVDAVRYLDVKAPGLRRLREAGITSALVVPPGELIRGQSALVDLPTDGMDGGNVGALRAGVVVKSAVALHVAFSPRQVAGTYPTSLLGSIAVLRQTLLDARHRYAACARQQPSCGPSDTPAARTLDALSSALAGRQLVAFEANEAREILRVLNLAKEFGLRPIVTGGREAGEVAADLKAAGASVLLSLDFPKPERSLPAGTEEPRRVVAARLNALKTAATLSRAGVLFAFAWSAPSDPRGFLESVARTVAEGLPEDAALRALTIDAARIAGADDRLGSLERGKTANVIVTSGELFQPDVAIRYLFIRGRLVDTQLGGGRRTFGKSSEQPEGILHAR